MTVNACGTESGPKRDDIRGPEIVFSDNDNPGFTLTWHFMYAVKYSGFRPNLTVKTEDSSILFH